MNCLKFCNVSKQPDSLWYQNVENEAVFAMKAK